MEYINLVSSKNKTNIIYVLCCLFYVVQNYYYELVVVTPCLKRFILKIFSILLSALVDSYGV